MSTAKKSAKHKPSKAHAGALQVIKGDDQDVLKGQQLTEVYLRAVSGMKDVLTFGAMMMKLREEHPEQTKAGRPTKKLSTVDNISENEPLPLQKWLDAYAPMVKRTTALRFLAVTESVCEEYAQIVGRSIAVKYTLQALVTTPADDLPPAAKAKQLTLFEFVSGTSQKSWLDRFVAPQSGGGNHRTTATILKPKTAKELEEEAEKEITTIMNSLDAFFLARHHTRVKQGTRETADAVLEEARQKLKTVKA